MGERRPLNLDHCKQIPSTHLKQQREIYGGCLSGERLRGVPEKKGRAGLKRIYFCLGKASAHGSESLQGEYRVKLPKPPSGQGEEGLFGKRRQNDPLGGLVKEKGKGTNRNERKKILEPAEAPLQDLGRTARPEKN